MLHVHGWHLDVSVCRGRVRGLGLKSGITLIAGGGFHGKSTLLRALEAGVYNKVMNDTICPWTGGQSAALNYFCDDPVLSPRPESTGAGCLPLPLLSPEVAICTIQCAVCIAGCPSA